MLWVDLNASVQDPETSKHFREVFEVHRLAALGSIDSEVVRFRPTAICFDFDFPTKAGLHMLQETKRKHASLPLVMLTVQHSEALAVWAFRSRVWDYLVKPVSAYDLDRCLSCLAEMLSARDLAMPPRRAAMPVSTVPEENRLSGARGHAPLVLAPAISYVESSYRDGVSSAKAAQLCSLTPFHFSRLFKETYDLTFREYVLRFKVREACRLLKNPNAPVADVAALVGFSDPSYFGKVFRRFTGYSPSRFSSVNVLELEGEHLLALLGGD